MGKHFAIACLAAGLAAVFAGQAMSSQPKHREYFDYKLEPVVLPLKGGPAELLFSFKMKPEYECDSVLVEVIPWKQLTFKGTSKFKVSLANAAEFSMTLAFTIPAHDTSAINIRLSCPNCVQGINRTFITTGDTIQVLDYIPTPLGPEPPREQRIITHYGPDSLRPPKEIDLRKGPDSASMWHEPTEEEIRQKTREARLRQMHEMEKQPLTHLEAQIFTIDSVDYIRRRGETRFHVAEPVKDPWEFSRHLADSVAALPPETECDVVLYLHEAELLELARELTDSLVPANRADYYLTRTTRGVIKRLSEAGARVTFLDKTPEGTFRPAADTSETGE